MRCPVVSVGWRKYAYSPTPDQVRPAQSTSANVACSCGTRLYGNGCRAVGSCLRVEARPGQAGPVDCGQRRLQLRHAVVRQRLWRGRILQRLEGLRARDDAPYTVRVGNPAFARQRGQRSERNTIGKIGEIGVVRDLVQVEVARQALEIRIEALRVLPRQQVAAIAR